MATLYGGVYETMDVDPLELFHEISRSPTEVVWTNGAVSVVERVLPWQLGGAFTLPGRGPVLAVIRYRRAAVLTDPRWQHLRTHEWCHVRQLLSWGKRAYVRRQILARVRTMSLLARSDPVESDCYDEAE